MDSRASVRVSICCITYNHKPYLRQCLEGFLMQKTTFPFEILIHDDASTDGTTDIVREYAAKYPSQIYAIIQTDNKYSTKTRAIITTYMLPVARGEYIALCEGDDYWIDPYKLQKQTNVLNRDINISLCLHPAVTIDWQEGQKIRKAYLKSRIADPADLIRWKGQHWITGSFMYRKDLMKNYPSFCLDCYVGDISLVYFLLTKGDVYFLNKVMSVYRKGIPGSYTQRAGMLDYYVQQQNLQTVINMIDGINALSDFRYDICFKERKVRMQLRVLKNRRGGEKVVYDDFMKI